MNPFRFDNITLTKQGKTKPNAYCLGYIQSVYPTTYAQGFVFLCYGNGTFVFLPTEPWPMCIVVISGPAMTPCTLQWPIAMATPVHLSTVTTWALAPALYLRAVALPYRFDDMYSWSVSISAQWRHMKVKVKSLTNWIFVQQGVKANKEEIIKAPHYTAPCEGNSLIADGFPSQRANDAGSGSMSWCHHKRC